LKIYFNPRKSASKIVKEKKMGNQNLNISKSASVISGVSWGNPLEM
jgi:hypothetical protein